MRPPVWPVFLPPPSWSWTYLGPGQSPGGPVSQLQTPGRTPACMPDGRACIVRHIYDNMLTKTQTKRWLKSYRYFSKLHIL